MKPVPIQCHVRTATGNGPARVLRRQGLVPAVLYGRNTASTLLSVPSRQFEKMLKQGGMGRRLLNLNIDGGDRGPKTVMIKEIQKHPVSWALIHIDFYEVSMDRKIRTTVPVTASGKSPGVERGGNLQLIRRELEVLCFPNEIPDAISIDISGLDIGDVVHVEEIKLPGNVEIPADVNFTVLTVISPKAAAAEAEAEAEEEAEEAESTAEAEEA